MALITTSTFPNTDDVDVYSDHVSHVGKVKEYNEEDDKKENVQFWQFFAIVDGIKLFSIKYTSQSSADTGRTDLISAVP